MRPGYEAYELKGKARTFVIRRDYVPGTPFVQPTRLLKADSTVDWRRRKGTVPIGDHVLAGPLSDLVLTLAPRHACRRAKAPQRAARRVLTP